MLLVDKPAGPTSHDVVAAVRRSFQTRRVGHAGTLDPFATGLLVVLVGRTTRLAQYLVGLPKEYSGTARLGIATTTDDYTGDPLGPPSEWESIPDQAIRDAMSALVGRMPQRPPRFSAKSVDGRRAYQRARREEFELEPREVEITRLELLSRNGADLEFRTSVASGVYVRSLARDLGERLGCGAHLAALRRTSIGPFELTSAVTMSQVTGRAAPLRPSRDAVPHLACREIAVEERVLVRQGRSIPATSPDTGAIALVSGPDLVAIAESDGTVLHPSVVLEDP